MNAHPEHRPVHEGRGIAAEFRKLTNKHYRALEREMGNKTPGEIYPGDFHVLANELP